MIRDVCCAKLNFARRQQADPHTISRTRPLLCIHRTDQWALRRWPGSPRVHLQGANVTDSNPSPSLCSGFIADLIVDRLDLAGLEGSGLVYADFCGARPYTGGLERYARSTASQVTGIFHSF